MILGVKMRNVLLLRKLAASGALKSSYDDVTGGSLTSLGESLPQYAYDGIVSSGATLVPQAVAPVPTLGGSIAHLVNSGKNVDVESLKKFSPVAFAPFAGSYRNALRDMYVDNKLSGGKNIHKNVLSERFGGATSSALASTVGALAGLPFGPTGASIGAITGLSTGGLGNLVGKLTGMIKGTSLKDQNKLDEAHAKYLNDSSAAWKNYLIPGMAAYNSGRRAIMKGNPL